MAGEEAAVEAGAGWLLALELELWVPAVLVVVLEDEAPEAWCCLWASLSCSAPRKFVRDGMVGRRGWAVGVVVGVGQDPGVVVVGARERRKSQRRSQKYAVTRTMEESG